VSDNEDPFGGPQEALEPERQSWTPTRVREYDLDRLRAEVERLTRERDEARLQVTREKTFYGEVREKWLAAEAEVKRMQRALGRYGTHESPCPAGIERFKSCTCGLSAALAKGEP